MLSLPILALSPVDSGEFGDNLSPNSATDRQSPFLATVAEFGDYSRQCGQGFTLVTRQYSVPDVIL